MPLVLLETHPIRPWSIHLVYLSTRCPPNTRLLLKTTMLVNGLYTRHEVICTPPYQIIARTLARRDEFRRNDQSLIRRVFFYFGQCDFANVDGDEKNRDTSLSKAVYLSL